MKNRQMIAVGLGVLAMVAAGCNSLGAAEVKAVSPPGAQIVGPYTPGLLAGKFLYVSGQGARNSQGVLPVTVVGQVKQSLDNVKAVVEAAGLTMENVVYSQMYLASASAYGDALAAWAEYFQGGGPARAVLGVSRMPLDTPVEISAVAFADLGQKHAVRLAGKVPAGTPPDAVIAGDRLYLSSCLGLDANGEAPADSAVQTQLALDRMGAVLKAAGISFDHMAFVNPYFTGGLRAGDMNRVYAKHFKFGDAPARATFSVVHLPQGASIAFTGVATMDLASRRSVRPKNMRPSATASPCVLAGDTLYCSAKSGFIPGPNLGVYAESIENQVRQSMRNLLDGLEEAGMDFSNVVATNVYLDDIQDFAKMNRVYALYVRAPFPTRTTVQHRPPVERKQNAREQWPELDEISLVAVK